jgi:hypothetical protein
MVYEPAHPVVAAGIEALCRASRSIRDPVRMLVSPLLLSVQGAPLEPAANYEALAQHLHRRGVAGIEFRGSLSMEVARRILDALFGRDRAGPADNEPLAARLNKLGEGAIHAHQISAHSVQLCALPSSGDSPGDGQSATVLASASVQGTRDGGGSSTADRGLPHAAVAAYRRCVDRGEMGTQSGALHALQKSFTNLSRDQREELVNALGTDPSVAFDDAAGILSLLPVDQLARSIEVLKREDSRLSATSLRLLKRLAVLAVGDQSELSRLAGVAEQWSQAADQAAESALSEATATLLRRLLDTEIRSTEYNELLVELSREGAVAHERGPLMLRAADELTQVDARASESICEILRQGVGDPEDRVDMVRQLAERGRNLAAAGTLDSVVCILEALDSLERGPSGAEDRPAARELMEKAAEEQWLERAIGARGEAATIKAALARRGLEGARAATTLARSVLFCRTDHAWKTLAAQIEAYPAEEARAGLEAGVRADVRVGCALVDLVERFCPADPIALFKDGIVHSDREHRIAACRAMARLVSAWPRDLCVRCMLDADPEVRRITIWKIAGQRDRCTTVLINALSGLVGRRVTSELAAQIKSALDSDVRGWVTSRLGWCLLTHALFPMRARNGWAVAAALRGRNSSLLGWSALAAWYISPFRLLARKGGRA